jgi:short-subunit dehydrogenase
MDYWRDKVVLVTGGSAGLGRVIAESFGKRGAKVVIAARDVEKLDAAARQMRSAGCSVTAIAADVTQQQQVDSLFAKTIGEFGKLDVLVNNAGRSSRGEALATSPDEFRELFELNFLSLVRCTQAAAPHLIQSKGHLVNIGSLAAKTVSRFLGAYPASKFPVAAFSQQLRYELGPQGVHVLLVCPGPIARDDAGQRYDEQARDLPGSARKPGGGVKLKGIPPDKLARLILRACERRRPELVVPAKAKLLLAISQLWPSLGDWIIGKMT